MTRTGLPLVRVFCFNFLAMPKWEYTHAVAVSKAFENELYVDGNPLEAFLDAMGNEGWELTAAPAIGHGVAKEQQVHLIFKAPVAA